jgi:hypothetical protein
LRNRPQLLILAILLAASLGLAAGPLVKTYEDGARLREALGDRGADERLAALDHPGYQIAQRLIEAVPPDACVVVMAYAGPAAIDYYRSRFNYFLYPRRVSVFPSSAAEFGDCEYVAVFRDTRQNLAAAPFQGTWNAEELQARLSSYQVASDSEIVEIYRRRTTPQQ